MDDILEMKLTVLDELTIETYVRYKKEGISHKEICKKHHVSKSSLEKWVRMNGLSGYGHKVRRTHRKIDKEKAFQMYMKGVDQHVIAEIYDCTRSAVSQMIKRRMKDERIRCMDEVER